MQKSPLPKPCSLYSEYVPRSEVVVVSCRVSSDSCLRLRELLFAEESEEADADAELEEEADPEPGLR